MSTQMFDSYTYCKGFDLKKGGKKCIYKLVMHPIWGNMYVDDFLPK